MRLLHTADWHVGKRLGRYDRMPDFVAVLDEITGIADREQVDLVVVAGDLFDRPTPSLDALRLVLDTLETLARDRPVVAIAGNHDSGALFDLLAPLIRPRGVHLIGTVRAPAAGGVLELATGKVRTLIGCLPFLREGQAVDFFTEADTWHREYAQRIAQLCSAHADHLAAHADDTTVTVLTGHFAVHGVKLGGGGAPRGERSLHLGEAYCATEQALPSTLGYVAMGHIHAPQSVPGMGETGLYSGSPIALDFGEADEQKRVVIVELEPGKPGATRTLPLRSGRPLRRARGRFDELTADPTLAEAFLDLEIETKGPDPGLADRAREAFPLLVKVRAAYERQTPVRPQARTDQSWDNLFADYYRQAHETAPEPALLDAFRAILDDVLDASA